MSELYILNLLARPVYGFIAKKLDSQACHYLRLFIFVPISFSEIISNIWMYTMIVLTSISCNFSQVQKEKPSLKCLNYPFSTCSSAPYTDLVEKLDSQGCHYLKLFIFVPVYIIYWNYIEHLNVYYDRFNKYIWYIMSPRIYKVAFYSVWHYISNRTPARPVNGFRGKS